MSKDNISPAKNYQWRMLLAVSLMMSYSLISNSYIITQKALTIAILISAAVWAALLLNEKSRAKQDYQKYNVGFFVLLASIPLSIIHHYKIEPFGVGIDFIRDHLGIDLLYFIVLLVPVSYTHLTLPTIYSV